MSRFDDDGVDGAGYNRPRRPKPETLTYLLGLPLDINVSTVELKAFATGAKTDENQNEVDYDFPPSIAASLSAIDEIRHEVASLAGDESGSQCIEVLAHIAAPVSEKAARVLLHGCAGYHLHLATHRYGSHVVQTLLELAVQKSEILVEHSSKVGVADLSEHEESPPVFQDVSFNDDESDVFVSPLGTLLQNLLEELSPHASTLSMHVCGSHVLRTLLCVIGGVRLLSLGPSGSAAAATTANTVTTMRGRPKKKKKKRKPDATPQKEPHAGNMRIVYLSRLLDRFDETTREDMRIALHSLSQSLVGVEFTNASIIPKRGDLQELACHQSAGPLLIIMLRVLTYSDETVKGDWLKNLETNAVTNSDFRLGIERSEPTFAVNSPAHQLVKHLICWQDGVSPQPHVGDIIYSFAGEARGSHVLETMLKISPDVVHDAIIQYGDFLNPSSMTDYVAHDVSNHVVQTLLQTIRSKESAERMLQMMVTSVLSNGYVLDGANHRRGIVWRTVELAAKYRVAQEGVLKALRIGLGSVSGSSKDDLAGFDDARNEDGTEGGKKRKKKRKKDSAIEIYNCVPMLLNVQLPPKDTSGRLGLDAAGARTVYHLLRFVPRLCEDVLKGILEELSADELFAIAKDGLGSRCIMDGILDGPSRNPIFGNATKQLREVLEGRWISLAVDRVGHHTVRKMFMALPRITDKAKLVEELASSGGNRLSGTSMGRDVMEACAMNEYERDKKAWRHTVSKILSGDGEKWIENELPSKNDRNLKGHTRTRQKRKHNTQEETKEFDNTTNEPSKKKSTSVDSIVKLMTIPNNSLHL